MGSMICALLNVFAKLLVEAFVSPDSLAGRIRLLDLAACRLLRGKSGELLSDILPRIETAEYTA